MSTTAESNFDTRRQQQREELLKRNFGDTKHPASLFDSFPQPDGKVAHMVKQEIIDSAIKNMGKNKK